MGVEEIGHKKGVDQRVDILHKLGEIWLKYLVALGNNQTNKLFLNTVCPSPTGRLRIFAVQCDQIGRFFTILGYL